MQLRQDHWALLETTKEGDPAALQRLMGTQAGRTSVVESLAEAVAAGVETDLKSAAGAELSAADLHSYTHTEFVSARAGAGAVRKSREFNSGSTLAPTPSPDTPRYIWSGELEESLLL